MNLMLGLSLAALLTGGAGGLSPTHIERGQAILDAGNGFSGRTYMASVPTMTLGGAGSASTLGGAAVDAPTYLMTDETIFARTAPDAPLKPNAAWGSLFSYLSTSGAQNTTGGTGPGYAFTAVACTAFDISCYSGGTVTRAFRVRVNGEWMQEADLVTAAWGAGRRYIKFTFAAAVTGLIEFFAESTMTILGANIAATSVAAPDTSADVKAEIWWDSYGAGGAAWTNSIWAAPSRLFLEAMGVRDPIPQGRASQGWENLVDGRNIYQRILLDKNYAIADPHFSAMCNSVNDRDEDPVLAAANMVSGVRTLQSAYPNSWIFVFVGFDTAVSGFPAGALDTMFEAVSAVANARTLIIDGRSWAKVSTTGTLPTGLPHDSIDAVHPGPNERAYLVAQMKAGLIAALTAALPAPPVPSWLPFTDSFDAENPSQAGTPLGWTRISAPMPDSVVSGGAWTVTGIASTLQRFVRDEPLPPGFYSLAADFSTAAAYNAGGIKIAITPDGSGDGAIVALNSFNSATPTTMAIDFAVAFDQLGYITFEGSAAAGRAWTVTELRLTGTPD